MGQWCQLDVVFFLARSHSFSLNWMFYPLVELESQICAFAGLVIKITFDIDASDDLKDFDGYFQYFILSYIFF